MLKINRNVIHGAGMVCSKQEGESSRANIMEHHSAGDTRVTRERGSAFAGHSQGHRSLPKETTRKEQWVKTPTSGPHFTK